jgi:hypothetical protein
LKANHFAKTGPGQRKLKSQIMIDFAGATQPKHPASSAMASLTYPMLVKRCGKSLSLDLPTKQDRLPRQARDTQSLRKQLENNVPFAQAGFARAKVGEWMVTSNCPDNRDPGKKR